MNNLTTDPVPAIRGWRWWVRELVSIFIWVLLLVGPFCAQFIDKKVLNKVFSVFTFESVIIGVLLLLAVSWLIGLRIMWHVAFIATYPLVIPARILPKICIRHWPILFIFLPGIRGMVRGMRIRAGFLCIALAAIVGSFTFTTFSLLLTCWVILCAYLMWIFCHQLHMAFRPATAYSELVDVLQRVSTWLPSPKEIVSKLPKASSSQAAEVEMDVQRSRAAHLFILYSVSTALLYVAQHLNDLQRSFKLDIYLVWCVVKSAIFTIFIFTVIFASMGGENVENFTVEGGVSPVFGEWLMFSFANLMTSDVSGISPASSVARAFASIELIFAFGLLVLLVFVVFTSLRDRHRNDLQLVVTKFKAASSSISDVFESDFALTKSAVEGIVIGFAPSLAMHLIALQHNKAYAEKLFAESQQSTAEKAPVEDGDVNIIELEKPKAAPAKKARQSRGQQSKKKKR